jgi:hypothetical protein
MSPDPLPAYDARAMHYLVGGGIASLATAILLVRDAGIPGRPRPCAPHEACCAVTDGRGSVLPRKATGTDS